MINIPTELLRTLVAIVDQRSFTKAAQSLGVTQPAVSAQIKRLQYLLGVELLDKRAPGVSLTPAGEVVVNYARRLLSINDQILDVSGLRTRTQTLRIGMTGDFAMSALTPVIARFRAERPEIRFVFRCRTIEALLKDLRDGDLDLVVGLSANGPAQDAHRHWTEHIVWASAPSVTLGRADPLPLVSYGEDCAMHRAAIAALNAAGRDSETVFSGTTIASIMSAVATGIGLTMLPPSHVRWPGVVVCEDASLPKMPDVFCGVYLREGADRALREELADAMEAAMRPAVRTAGAARPGEALSTVAASPAR